MSLYFEGYLAFDLFLDTPKEVLDVLTYLCRVEDYEFHVDIDHQFFAVEEWRNFLQVDDIVNALPGNSWSDFRKFNMKYRTGEDQVRHTLSFRRILHDDTDFYHLWWYFLYWIAPYVETRGFIGFYREILSLHPNPIYVLDGKVYRSEISMTPIEWYGEEWNAPNDYIIP